MKKSFIISLLVFCFMIIAPQLTFSQDPPDPGGEVDGVPIDGGITLLVAVGIAYGAKKVHDARKKKSGEIEN